MSSSGTSGSIAAKVIAVAAARHEIVDGDTVGLVGVERRAADRDGEHAAAGRLPRVELDRHAGHLRKPPGGGGQPRQAVLDRETQIAALDVERHQMIAERQLRLHVAAGDGRARLIDLAAADAAAVHDRGVGAGPLAHRVGDEIADRRLAAAHGGVAAVQRDGGGRERHAHLAVQRLLEARHHGRDLRVRRHSRGVDHAELRPPFDVAPVALLLRLDVQVDDRDIVRVVGRLDHQRAAVELDEEIVVVTGQDHIGRMGLGQIDALLAVGVHHHDDEIDAVAAQRLGLRLHGGDGRQELQILGVRHARRAVVRRAGQPDPHAVEADDVAVLDSRQRLAVRPGHVGGKDRKRRLRHVA